MSKRLPPVKPRRIGSQASSTKSGLFTAETAVLLGHYFGTSADIWMNLQTRYDLRIAQRDAAAGLRELPRPGSARRKQSVP